MKRDMFALFGALLAICFFSSGCQGNLNTNIECTPSCAGKSCGTDGCGGVCGICGPGLACGENFTCVSSGCGNGRVDRNETCDIAITEGEGVCPTECPDDGNACTEEQLFGNPQDCDVECRAFVTIMCTDGDACCPDGCSETNDSDCSVNCGNGQLDGSETCDPPETCPSEADCDDMDACTNDMLTGSSSTCSAQCANVAITECVDDDGCCPAGCTMDDDNDCTAVCGDGTVQMPSETCDTGIDAGMPGACITDPAECADADACTADVLAGDSTMCTSECQNNAITTCTNDDGCCPPTCTPAMDNDCNAVCDNGVVEAGEECDPISSCPTACDDMDACTTDTLMGDPAQCTAVCDFAPITACTGGDGCCPDTCTVAMDSDCQSVCDSYCSLALSECTGADEIYADMATCMTACQAIPVGIDGDTTGNTLYCRIGYLNMASMDTTMYCPYAAEDGGVMCM